MSWLGFGRCDHDHVRYIQSKVIPKIRTLGKIAPIVKRSTSLMIYKTLILPIMEYGDVVYDCLTVKDADTLQKLQNACLKGTLYYRQNLDVSDFSFCPNEGS